MSALENSVFPLGWLWHRIIVCALMWTADRKTSLGCINDASMMPTLTISLANIFFLQSR